jgi:predicted DNA-binding transcriptional regulator YafY
MDNFLDFENFHSLNEDFKENFTKLEDAISNKFVLNFYYKGEQKGVVDDGYREVEPYALGVNKHGNTVLRAWLIKGISRSGKIDPSLVPGWRLFRVDRIGMVNPTLSKFTTPRKGYNADDQGMTEVHTSAQF